MARHNIVTEQFAVTSTPQNIFPASLAGDRGDITMVLSNLSANNIYYGGVVGVTASNGAIIKPFSNSTPDLYLEASANVFVVVSSGTANLSVAFIY